MLDNSFGVQVALYEPEIPPNTGNIIRLCANTGAGLDLIGPLGFQLDDKRLRRAGLDYHEYARLHSYADYPSWLASLRERDAGRVLAFSTRGKRSYADVDYRCDDILLFGPETRGLPQTVLDDIPAEQWLRIPMRPDNRSINLSNAVAVVVYEAWRQMQFNGGG
jgi:tRNA (cytidine/uridine-2'-O-)-methyltransferase